MLIIDERCNLHTQQVIHLQSRLGVFREMILYDCFGVSARGRSAFGGEWIRIVLLEEESRARAQITLPLQRGLLDNEKKTEFVMNGQPA